jgi:hypothetical protein
VTAEPELLTIPEVMVKLRKKYRFVLNELKCGNLRGSHFGGQWHVQPADLTAYIEAHANVRPVEKRQRRAS